MSPRALPSVAAALATALTATPAIAQYTLYYGNFHAHCTISEDAQGPSSGPPEEAFQHARDVADIDILALTDHSHYMSASEYSTLLGHSNSFTQNGVFVAIAGQEHGSLSTTVSGAFGHINIWEFSGVLDQGLFRYDLPATYSVIANNNDRFGNPLLASFNHPYSSAGAGQWAQFQNFAYSATGDEGMQFVEVINGKRTADYESEYFEALTKGWHLGALGNQDNHEGNWGDQLNNVGKIPLTGVWATALTKQDVLEAMAARRTFAMEVSPATDRISLRFTADGNWMGSEYSTDADSILFHVQASATDNGFANARLYRNGTLVKQTGSAASIDWNTFDTPGPGDFHYQVIVTQSDGDNAWSSPIWIASTSLFSVPIAQVNEDDANGFPTMLFQTVTVQGIVTVDTDTLSTVDNQFFIQDATGGLMILETNVQDPSVVAGDNVLVTGFVNTVLGQTFVDPSSGTIEIQSQGGAPPAPVLLGTNQLASGGETWEGQLVELRDVEIVSGTWPSPGFDGTVMIDDGSGPCGLFIDKDTSLDDAGAPVDPVFSVRGILVQRDPSTPYTSDYRVMPRFGDDIFQLTGVGVDELPSHHTATRTALHQNTPNPFRPNTAVGFDIAGDRTPVRIEIYDVTGRLVRTLVNEPLAAGSYETRWDSRDERGQSVAAGIYFYRLVTSDADLTRKMVVLR